MRIHLLLLLACVLGLLTTANADPDNLEGGVLITHAASPDCLEWIGYYGGDPCAAWEDGTAPCAIEVCEEQVNWIPADGALNMQHIWVVAAWYEEKLWCGFEFGISPSFNEQFYFVQWGSCGPDHLELPTGEWPGAGEGVAVASIAEPWEGNFYPIYYFLGYSYEPSLLELDVDPITDFAGFANCDMPSILSDAECLGAIGIGEGMEGYDCCPFTPELWACCFADWSCVMLMEQDCIAAGGAWVEGASCDDVPDPCSGLIRACCVGAQCTLQTSGDCYDLGGDWLFYIDTCDPNPCVTPTREDTWGSIKALYR